MTLEQSSGIDQLWGLLNKMKLGTLSQNDLMVVKTLWKSLQNVK